MIHANANSLPNQSVLRKVMVRTFVLLLSTLLSPNALAADKIRENHPICGALRVYSATLSLLLVPRSLKSPEIDRYELRDQTGNASFQMTAPWWICVTQGEINRSAKGNLSDAQAGSIVVRKFAKDQTSLEMGAE